jgi:uncharacterized membrane protein
MTWLAIRALFGRLPWRIILPAIGAVLAVWAAYSWAYGRGRDVERAKWQAAAVAAEKAAAARTEAMQNQVDAAGAALSVQQGEIDRLTAIAHTKRSAFYVQNPAADVPCLLPERLHAIADADAAAQAASAPQ